MHRSVSPAPALDHHQVSLAAWMAGNSQTDEPPVHLPSQTGGWTQQPNGQTYTHPGNQEYAPPRGEGQAFASVTVSRSYDAEVSQPLNNVGESSGYSQHELHQSHRVRYPWQDFGISRSNGSASVYSHFNLGYSRGAEDSDMSPTGHTKVTFSRSDPAPSQHHRLAPATRDHPLSITPGLRKRLRRINLTNSFINVIRDDTLGQIEQDIKCLRPVSLPPPDYDSDDEHDGPEDELKNGQGPSLAMTRKPTIDKHKKEKPKTQRIFSKQKYSTKKRFMSNIALNIIIMSDLPHDFLY